MTDASREDIQRLDAALKAANYKRIAKPDLRETRHVRIEPPLPEPHISTGEVIAMFVIVIVFVFMIVSGL